MAHIAESSIPLLIQKMQHADTYFKRRLLVVYDRAAGRRGCAPRNPLI